MIKLLIADDEEIVRQGLKSLIAQYNTKASNAREHLYAEDTLSLGGIDVVGLAEDGLEALEMARKTLPEILLIDIDMPRLSGLELIEQLHGVLPDSKFIIISGYGDFGYAQRAVELNVFRYLLKPIRHEELNNALRGAIEAYASRLWELNRLGSQNSDTLSTGELPRRVLRYIDMHYSDSELNLQSIADTFNISKSYLSRIIKEQTGDTFPTYLTELRMEQAVRLLRESRHLMVYAVAGMVGYVSQHYFCKVFKEHTGMSPSEYRGRVSLEQSQQMTPTSDAGLHEKTSRAEAGIVGIALGIVASEDDSPGRN